MIVDKNGKFLSSLDSDECKSFEEFFKKMHEDQVRKKRIKKNQDSLEMIVMDLESYEKLRSLATLAMAWGA